MADRDFVAEMQARVQAAIPQDGGWVPGVVAAKLVAELAERDPDLLEGWLHVMSVPLLTDQITYWERNRRARARRNAQARDFAQAAGAGDLAALGLFMTTFAVDEEDTRLRVADMRGPHHLFVAAGYTATSHAAALEAEFHRQVARKLNGRTTSEVYTEEQYTAMYRSVTGGT